MDWELFFWVVLGLSCLVVLIGCLLPINPYFDPKANDPYKYCPKG
jgi:hypothetical protein